MIKLHLSNTIIWGVFEQLFELFFAQCFDGIYWFRLEKKRTKQQNKYGFLTNQRSVLNVMLLRLL